MTAEQFKAWRKRLGFNQAEAAAALGMSAGTVLNYERGSRREDGRPVEIPRTVELACDAIAIDAAAERGDLNVLSDAQRERVLRIMRALPAGWR